MEVRDGSAAQRRRASRLVFLYLSRSALFPIPSLSLPEQAREDPNLSPKPVPKTVHVGSSWDAVARPGTQRSFTWSPTGSLRLFGRAECLGFSESHPAEEVGVKDPEKVGALESRVDQAVLQRPGSRRCSARRERACRAACSVLSVHRPRRCRPLRRCARRRDSRDRSSPPDGSSRPGALAVPLPAGASSASSPAPSRPAGGRGRTARVLPPRRSCPRRSRLHPQLAARPGARTRASRPPTL